MAKEDERAESCREKLLQQNDAKFLSKQRKSREAESLRANALLHFRVLRTGNISLVIANYWQKVFLEISMKQKNNIFNIVTMLKIKATVSITI